MKQLVNDKFSIAWFKLADCVLRGEKERAFGIYRLLAHSFEDKALASQLEGDLLWSFQDTNAIEKYQLAVELYQKNDRLLEAAAVSEHLISLNALDKQSWPLLIELYKKMELHNKLLSAQEEYMQFLATKQEWHELVKFSKQFSSAQNMIKVGGIIERIIEKIASDQEAQVCCLSLIQQLIILWHELAEEQLMQFFSRLQLIDHYLYARAYDLLCK